MLWLQNDQTSNNPLRFRRQILELTQDFLTNPDTMRAGFSMLCWSAAYFSMPKRRQWWKKTVGDISFQTISNIEQRLERIDDIDSRLEKRAAIPQRLYGQLRTRPGQ